MVLTNHHVFSPLCIFGHWRGLNLQRRLSTQASNNTIQYRFVCHKHMKFVSGWIDFESLKLQRFDFSARSLPGLRSRNVVNEFQSESNCFTVNINIGTVNTFPNSNNMVSHNNTWLLAIIYN